MKAAGTKFRGEKPLKFTSAGLASKPFIRNFAPRKPFERISTSAPLFVVASVAKGAAFMASLAFVRA